LIPRQHWTKPPPRYTEASLVKELERRGIGRPSTFAAMVALIRDRGYVRREKKVLVPTPLGFILCDVLVAAFPDLFDYGFTARMEDGLDDIANGQAERLATLEGFWANLSGALEQAREEMPTVRLEGEKPQPTGENCPDCGGELLRRKGKYSYFVGCANFPRCKYIQPRQPETTGQKCPQCGGDLVVRRGRYGPFVGCANYPACKYIDKTASQNRSKGNVVKQK